LRFIIKKNSEFEFAESFNLKNNLMKDFIKIFKFIKSFKDLEMVLDHVRGELH